MTRPPSKIPALTIRQRLGRDTWRAPVPFGPDGYKFLHQETYQDTPLGSIIITCSEVPGHHLTGDLTEWIHASWAWIHRQPRYDELMQLKAAVWPSGYAYQVHPPESDHVNIHEFALHLWGRADGKPALPDFAPFGTI